MLLHRGSGAQMRGKPRPLDAKQEFRPMLKVIVAFGQKKESLVEYTCILINEILMNPSNY